jgi:hypothetical protein
MIDNGLSDGSITEEETGAEDLSLYHRKLLATSPQQLEKPEWLAPWNDTTLEQRRMWPTWWNASLEAQLQEDVLIGIVTTASMHNRLSYQRKSWWTDERLDMVEVYTDIDHDPNVTNLIYSHCDSSYNYGLWCKNTHMLQMWQTPRYRKYKWFIRANDDSYYHLENIYDLVSKMDHTKPIVIGEKFCSDNPDGNYPSGGPGIILSRAFIDNIDWEKWNNPLKRRLKVREFFEDVLWGRFLNDTGTSHFIQHHGISQAPMLPNSGHMNLFMDYRGKPWPLPFRPLAYHQSGKWTTMPILHRKLHAIDYYPPARITFELPVCGCKYNFHSRCMWDLTKKGARIPCRWDGLQVACLGPGDYSLKGYKALLNSKNLTDDRVN